MELTVHVQSSGFHELSTTSGGDVGAHEQVRLAIDDGKIKVSVVLDAYTHIALWGELGDRVEELARAEADKEIDAP